MMIAFNGMPVFEVPPWMTAKPRFRLSPNVPVTSEFRADFDAWARQFFGEEDTAIVAEGRIYLSPKAYAELRKVAR